jgi:putrescine transport system permease protein
MDRSLQEAAMDLGGRPMQVAFDITLPLIASSMLSGWLLAFTLSLDDLVIASFTSGAGASTLPMVIFSKIKLGVTPDINALASLIIGTVAVGIFIASWIIVRREQKNTQKKSIMHRQKPLSNSLSSEPTEAFSQLSTHRIIGFDD